MSVFSKFHFLSVIFYYGRIGVTISRCFPQHHVFSDFSVCDLSTFATAIKSGWYIYRSIEKYHRISDNNGAFLDKIIAWEIIFYGNHHTIKRYQSRKILLCSRRKKDRRDVPFLMPPKKIKRKRLSSEVIHLCKPHKWESVVNENEKRAIQCNWLSLIVGWKMGKTACNCIRPLSKEPT